MHMNTKNWISHNYLAHSKYVQIENLFANVSTVINVHLTFYFNLYLNVEMLTCVKQS